MLKNRKIYHLGLVTFTITTLLTGCPDKPSNQNNEEIKTTSEQATKKPESHQMPNHVMKKKDKNPDDKLVKDDIAFLTQLGLMRGHLLVGYELYKANHPEHAKTHMKHPQMELYADVEPAFAPRGATGFADELTALAVSVEQEKENAIVDAAYKNVVEAIAKTETFVKPETAATAKQFKLVAELLKIAGEEYAIAVVDGKMENAHEYQDAYGFTQICKKILSNIKTSNDHNKEIVAKAQAAVNELAPMWPSLVPPNTLETEASQLYGAAAKIEILALGLQ